MTTDLANLAAAVRRQPEDDNVRLVLADCLEEHAQADPVRMECPACKGKKVHRLGHVKCDIRGIHDTRQEINCEVCGGSNDPKSPSPGSGTVIDPAREQWAELIRVQCELVRLTAGLNWSERYERWHDLKKGEYVAMTGWLEKTPELQRREAALLAALDHCRPKCPACNDESGHRVHCTFCVEGTAGRLALSWVRGGVSCKVPRLADVWDRVSVFPEADAPKVWQPTELGRELAALPLLEAVECGDTLPLLEAVECGDKRPFFYSDAPKFGWSRDRQEALPPHIWDLLPAGNVYDTPLAARDALARAVAISLADAQEGK